ncbi:hypothetical protein N7453_002354 [Penicillium expansum]|nr:hypothetical protein N7453_002354 [Penicillium expansum]
MGNIGAPVSHTDDYGNDPNFTVPCNFRLNIMATVRDLVGGFETFIRDHQRTHQLAGTRILQANKRSVRENYDITDEWNEYAVLASTLSRLDGAKGSASETAQISFPLLIYLSRAYHFPLKLS